MWPLSHPDVPVRLFNRSFLHTVLCQGESYVHYGRHFTGKSFDIEPAAGPSGAKSVFKFPRSWYNLLPRTSLRFMLILFACFLWGYYSNLWLQVKLPTEPLHVLSHLSFFSVFWISARLRTLIAFKADYFSRYSRVLSSRSLPPAIFYACVLQDSGFRPPPCGIRYSSYYKVFHMGDYCLSKDPLPLFNLLRNALDRNYHSLNRDLHYQTSAPQTAA